MATPFGKVPSSTEDSIQKLGGRYKLEDSAAVEAYLRSNDFLTCILSEAHEKITDLFGPGAQVSLKVVEEPEAKDSRRLFILIRPDMRPKEAIGRLDKLDENWWLDALPAARGKLSIDVEYG